MAGKQIVSEERRRNANVMAAHLRAWTRSGLSQAAYCQRVGVGIRKFTYWRRKFGKEARNDVKFVEVVSAKRALAPKPGLLPMELRERATRASLSVKLCGGRFAITIPADFAEETLVRVVAALERS